MKSTPVWILLIFFYSLPLPSQTILSSAALYQKGLEQLQAGDYPAAATTFQSIVDSDKKNEQAWIGLGHAHNGINPGSSDAENAFNRAIRLNRKNGQAYYGLGITWINRPNRHKESIDQLKLAVHFSPDITDAWKLLGDLHEQNANEKPAVNTYASALLANPDHDYFYDNLLRSAMVYQYEKIAVKTLNKFLDLTDDPGKVKVGLAETHRHKGDLKQADDILNALMISETPWPQCLGSLVKARVCFDRDQDDQGIAYYWSAVNTIQKSSDRKLFFDDLCFIMQDHEYDAHNSAPDDSLTTFYQRFWRSRDPNMMTEINERIPEHYKRLTEAEKKWRRSPAGYAHSILIHKRVAEGGDALLALKEFEDVQSEEMAAFRDLNIIGDEFIEAAHFPKALPHDRTIDDLAVVYIRHGKPTQEIMPNLSGGGNNTTWIYEQNENHARMIFHFQRIGDHTGWIVEAIPGNTENLETIHGRYMELQDMEAEELRYSPSARGFAEDIVRENLVFLEQGMTTETTNYQIEESPMQLPYQYLDFKGEDKNEIELFYLIHGGAVDLDTSQNKVDLEQFICIHNQKWDEVNRNTRSLEKSLTMTAEQWAGSGFVMRETFPLDSGDYFTELQIIDKIGSKRAVHKDSLSISNYHQNRLMLSDIIIASEIDEAQQSPFERNGIPITPHMFYAFNPGDFVGVYFEIYNLRPDTLGKTEYQVSFTIQHASQNRSDKNTGIFGFVKNMFMDKRQVTTQFDSEGRTPDDYIYMNLQFPDRQSGEYDLIIQVKDLKSGHVLAKRTAITLL